MKKIIVFIDRDAQEKARLFLQTIQKRLPGVKMHICQNVASCVTEISGTTPSMEKPIIVLFIHNIERLNDLYEKKELLQDTKIVLILPAKKSHDTISIVHRFSPRYFTDMDGQYEDLCDVLHKMIVQ